MVTRTLDNLTAQHGQAAIIISVPENCDALALTKTITKQIKRENIVTIPFMLMPPAFQDMIARQRKAAAERRMKSVEPWSPAIKWEPELNIKADTYHPYSLFAVKPLVSYDVNKAKDEHLARSPNGRWCYLEKVFPRGRTMPTIYGGRQGDVLFDGDVIIPGIHDRRLDRWSTAPWMSLTPMEYITMRAGTRRAKGRVIVAGLGMGLQLIEVSKRKQVKRLTLVEISQELVDWLFPRIKPMLGCPVEIVVGDAYEVLPTMTADVTLVDIYRSYGGNKWDRDRLHKKCPGIDFMWAWGA